MTSLQRQLERLRIPETKIIQIQEKKKKASLLFDRDEAARLDKQTFYEIGINGLQELEQFDKEFSKFHLELFSETSVLFNRSVQSTEINKKLDAIIKRFLLRLSPYFLLKPAHKALEWLIQRFNINYYNVNELLLSVLPYHEDKLFVQVVRLFSLAKNDKKWGWLSGVQKNGIHLSRQTVINHCLSDLSLLSFIQNMVSDYVQEFSKSPSSEPQLRHIFAFYTQVICGILDQKEISETVIGQVLPFLDEGLRSGFTDYKAGSLMIISIIFVRSKLTQPILESLIYTIVKFTMKTKAIFEEAMCCLVLLFQTQTLRRLKKRVCRYLVNYQQLVPVLEKIGKDYKLDNFLMALFQNLVPKALSNCLKMSSSAESSDGSISALSTPFKSVLTDILRYLPLNSSTSSEVALCVIRVYVEHAIEIKRHHREQFQVNVCEIMRVLEARHAVALDEAVQSYMERHKTSKSKKIIFNLLNYSLESAQHKLLPGTGASLTTSLYHPLAEFRIQAISFLKSEKVNVADDTSFYEQALLLRLADDVPKVVEAVTELKHRLWQLLDGKSLIEAIKNILLKTDTESEWNSLKIPAIKILLLCNNVDLYPEIIAILAPYILHMTTVDESLFKIIISSPFAAENSFPKELSGNPRQFLIEIISRRILDVPAHKALSTFNMFLDSLPNQSPRRACFLCFMLEMFSFLYQELDKHFKSTFDLCLCTIKIIKEILTKKQIAGKIPFHEEIVLKQGSVGMDKDAQVRHCAVFLEKFIDSLAIVDSLTKGTIFWEYYNNNGVHDTCIQLIIQLFGLLVKYTEKYKKFKASESNLVNVFFGELVKYDVFDKFLCFLWTADMQQRSAAHIISQQQISALKTGYIWIKSVDPNYVHKWMLSPVPVMVSMIAALGSKKSMIRKAAASCMPVVYPKGHRKTLPYHYFLKKLIADLDTIESYEDLPRLIGQVMNYESNYDSDSSMRDIDSSSRKRTVQDIFNVMIMETTPFYIIKSMLEAFKEFNNMELMSQLIPLLSRLLDMLKTKSLTQCQHDSLNLLLLRYSAEIASYLTVDSQAFKLFGKVISLKNCANQKQQLEIQEFAIKLINKEFYLSLPNDDSQQQLMSHLFTALVESDFVGTPELIRKLLKHFSIKSSYLLNELDIFQSHPVRNTVFENKRLQMLTGETEANQLDSLSWQRVIVVLEILQNKKKLREPQILLPICFKLLSRVLELEENNSAEYLKQLLLSCICNISNHMINNPDQLAILQTQKFDMELIVKCIRTSSSPQTHHHALLLLTVAAKIDPEMLLHNVMAVFTFVGGTMVRQDDTYSFSMIYRTLETVIPALLAACEERAKYQNADVGTVDDVIPMVLKVFVDAFPHIPAHRRIMLFKELSRIISQGRHLSCLLLLFVEHVVVHSVPKEQTDDNSQSSLYNSQSPEGPPPELEFALNLSFQFPPEQQLDAIRDGLLYLSTLPTEIKQSAGKKKSVPEIVTQLRCADTEIFNTEYHTSKQLRHFKYSSVNFFVSLLERTEFISQIANTSEATLQEHYEKLLEVVFNYLSKVSKMADQQQQLPTSRFWKILLGRVSHLLDKVCTLLPNRVFISVISTLITHQLTTVQKKSMDLLNTKLTEVIPRDMHSMLLPLVTKLTDIVEKKIVTENSMDDSCIVICQTAMYSLKLLCRHLTCDAATELKKTLLVSIQILRQREDSPQLMACSLLCIGEICSTPFEDPIVLKQIPTLMPIIMNLLDKRDFLLRNTLLLLSTVTALQRLLQYHSVFLSPYIGNILDYICCLSCEEDINIPNLVLRLKGVSAVIASKVPPRILVTVITKQYTSYLLKNKSYISCLMAILSDHITNSMTKEEVNNQFLQLEQFFLTCLEFRLQCKASKVDNVDIDGIEGEIIKSIISLVMKLSESKFKPFFLKFFNWCVSDKTNKLRVLVFYRLAESLAVSLRSLFLIFAGHIVKHMAEVLDQYNKDKNPDLQWKKHMSTLLIYVIDCAHKCFLYDTDGFVNKESFDLLMTPLVDQISNMYDKRYNKRVNDHLIPCLSQLAVATHDDTLWKSLNYQVLLKTKHSAVNVRLASLTMINELHKKLGESYLNLLPETVPFLAELMEDECETIEKKCQQVLCEMEKTLGEPLQKYF
ncbi:HEAT repeat-containing protein 1 [Octopus bimaculoides]|nr:HEAT repeat-containing protein 1 [Octopus bimaculoides]|eukprot:XP_014780648.1 PREDICTED: HEAT repeat-containing protein 1-like [Octopus bimaculoides]